MAGREGRLPIAAEAQEAGQVDRDPLRLAGIRADQVEDLAGSLDETLEQGERAFAPGLGSQLVERLEQAAQLGPGVRADIHGPDRVDRRARQLVFEWPAESLDLDLTRSHDLARDVDQVAA